MNSNALRIVALFGFVALFVCSLTLASLGADPVPSEPVKTTQEQHSSAPSSEAQRSVPIDTLLIWDEFSLDGSQVLGPPNSFNHSDLRPAVMEVITQELAGTGITVKTGYNSPVEDLNKPSVVNLEIAISTRRINTPGKTPLKLASVSAVLKNTCHKCVFTERAPRFSVPFVVSDDKADNLSQIQDAVKLLTSKLLHCLNAQYEVDRCDIGRATY